MASGQQDQALMPVGGSGGLMLPPAPRPPTKRKVAVLDEDEYTANLESIIERDFFPELSKLESKVAWLQAIRSGDPEQIREAQMLIARRRAAVGGRPLTGVTPSAAAPLFTPGGTAARAMVGDTPYIPVLPPGVPLRPAQARPATGGSLARGTAGGGEDDDDDDDEERVVVAPPVSLDGFLAVHTSEDNASFQEILEGVNKRKRQRAAALLIPQPDPKLMITEGRERTDGFGTSGQQPDTLVQWKYEPRNALYYDSSHRDAVPFSDAELAAMVQGAPKAINHGGTRFPRELAPSSSATPSASSGGGGSGSVAGGTAGAAAAAAGAAAAAARGAAAGRGGGGSGAGYSIMGTPSFSPGVGQTPIMTWGDIDATPLRIEVEDLPPGPFTEGPSFYIKEASRKDQAGHVLATKAGASLRLKRGSLQGGTPLAMVAAHAAARRQGTAARLGTGLSGRPPTDGQQQQRRGKPLSAAAQRLASSMHKGRQTDTDMGLRASYSGSTPVQRRPGTGRQPASSIASGSWSAQPTPRRGATPAGSCTPSVHATLEEEELRVQAVLRQRQRQTQQQQELEAARVAAKQALQNLHVQPAARAAAPAAAGGAANTSLGGAATSDLTAGLLDI